jgi:Flp pilus assembly pilin Flp
LTQLLKRLWPEEEAQSLSEYALLLFLVSLTAVTAMGSLATRVTNVYSIASMHMETARGASLSGGSLSYGAQPHTNTPPRFQGR